MGEEAFVHRIAFGVWINDIRSEPITGENWPSMDMETFLKKVRDDIRSQRT